MENIETPASNSLGRNALTHGLITGALLILFSLLTYALGMMENKAMSYVTFILLVGGMYYGTKTYREKFLDGFLSYGKAFNSTFLIGLVASVILGIYIFVFYQYFDPEMINGIREQAEQEILKRNPEISEQELDMALSMAGRFTTPVWMAFFAFLTNVFVSAIISLIISIFLKKEDPSQQQMI